MSNKILWLSILGLALAKPPNPIDLTSSKFGQEEKQRSSRSIWPFTSSETTTEEPEAYPPLLPDNNEWFVQGETPLPEGIDLTKYPIWKVHKYNGINLHPVKLQPQNYYPPEETIVETGYPSGPNLSPDLLPNDYLSGYQDFLDSRGQIDHQSQTIHGTYPAEYPLATSPSEKENFRTGKYHSSSITPGIKQYNIQTQQKHEVYVPPQPLTDFRPTAIPEVPNVPGYQYGPPNGYHHSVSADYHHQEHVQHGQGQTVSSGGEKSSTIQPQQPSNGKEPDLSLLDQLSALNSFFPGDDAENSESSSPNNKSETPQQGFFENLFSRFRGTTEAPAPPPQVVTSEIEEQTKSKGGFFSSLFGQRYENSEAPVESGSLVNTESSSGNVFSSLFYQPETERPAVVLPTTYYLPRTRGSYIAVKVPATNTVPGLGQTLGPFDDLSNIAFNDVPRVPFKQHEIPDIPGPTLDSGYPYNPGYLDVRNSGFAGSSINADYPPSVGSSRPHPAPTVSESYSTRQESGYRGSDHQVDQDFPPFSPSSPSADNTEALDQPRAEYLHSANEDQVNGSPVLASSKPTYHREEQSATQSDRQSTNSYKNSLSSTSVDDATRTGNNDFNIQSQSGAGYRYQNFGTTNSNFRTRIRFGENVGLTQETVPIDNRDDQPITAPRLTSDYIPVLSYEAPGKRIGQQLNSDNGNEEDNGQKFGEDNVRGNSGDVLSENFEGSSLALEEDLGLPLQSEPSQSSVPVYETSVSDFQSPAVAVDQEEMNRFLPIKEAVDFNQGFDSNQEEFEHNRIVENLSSLTSLGASTNSYQTDPFATASSNVRVITVYPSTPDKISDRLDVNTNKDAFRSTSPTEELPGTNKADRRVIVRKFVKRRNFLEGNNNSQVSHPARKTPAEETDAASMIRSEDDSILEIRGGRKFDETDIITAGYSKVHHPQHKILQEDNHQAIEPANHKLEGEV